MTPVQVGILLRLLSTVFFAFMAVSVRSVADQVPLGQIVFFRSFLAIPPVFIYLLWRHQLLAGLRTAKPLGHAGRSLTGCGAMFFSFTALAHLPLANATALAFLAPLMTVAFAVFYLKERPGPIVFGALIVGFSGVILTLLPAFGGTGSHRDAVIGTASGVAMAFCTALAIAQLKRLTATEAPGAIAFYFAITCSLIGLMTLPLGWVVPSGSTLFFLCAAGLTGGLAQIVMTESYARAPASTLAPIEYVSMLWALGFDVLWFKLVPAPLSLLGAVVIVGAAAAVAFSHRRKPPQSMR